MKTFAKKLCIIRKQNGISQEELAHMIGVTRQTISKWELGETSPKVDDLEKIAQVLNISTDELLNNTSPKNVIRPCNIKFILILLIILAFILIYIFYRISIIHIFINKLSTLSSDNYFIEKIVLSEENNSQQITENIKYYFFDNTLKTITFDINNSNIITSTEYYTNNNTYYYFDEINQTYHTENIGKNFPITKDSLLNEIYTKLMLGTISEKIRLLFNINYNISKYSINTNTNKEKYYKITNYTTIKNDYIFLQYNQKTNSFEFIKKFHNNIENDNSKIVCYKIQSNTILKDDIKIPDLNNYKLQENY